ncbi:MAG TPA: hypothetical protein VGR45_17265 [Stellaceae bacterium]|nr:hypothetical protein [Stellaceae bacterium]
MAANTKHILAAIAALSEAISADKAALTAALSAQFQDLAKILAWANPSPPARIALELPTITTKEGIIVPNFELKNDQVATITIKTTDAAGAVVPAPAGDTFTVVSGTPASLQAAIGTDAGGNAAVVLTPLVDASPGLTITVSDASGLPALSQIVDIVPDLSPTNMILDLADATFAPQAVPAAPGP